MCVALFSVVIRVSKVLTISNKQRSHRSPYPTPSLERCWFYGLILYSMLILWSVWTRWMHLLQTHAEDGSVPLSASLYTPQSPSSCSTTARGYNVRSSVQSQMDYIKRCSLSCLLNSIYSIYTILKIILIISIFLKNLLQKNQKKRRTKRKNHNFENNPQIFVYVYYKIYTHNFTDFIFIAIQIQSKPVTCQRYFMLLTTIYHGVS